MANGANRSVNLPPRAYNRHNRWLVGTTFSRRTIMKGRLMCQEENRGTGNPSVKGGMGHSWAKERSTSPGKQIV